MLLLVVALINENPQNLLLMFSWEDTTRVREREVSYCHKDVEYDIWRKKWSIVVECVELLIDTQCSWILLMYVAIERAVNARAIKREDWFIGTRCMTRALAEIVEWGGLCLMLMSLEYQKMRWFLFKFFATLYIT